jgi:hypothetical protein
VDGWYIGKGNLGWRGNQLLVLASFLVSFILLVFLLVRFFDFLIRKYYGKWPFE